MPPTIARCVPLLSAGSILRVVGPPIPTTLPASLTSSSGFDQSTVNAASPSGTREKECPVFSAIMANAFVMSASAPG